MSSEFSCDYCSACPRHPCYSKKEAAHCPNCESRGLYLDFRKEDVMEWLRTNLRYRSNSKIIEALDLIERHL
jgi:hypothetical protein